MADKVPLLAAELGTYAAEGPIITLSGTKVRVGDNPSRTFAAAAADASTDFADGDTCTVTIASSHRDWQIYSAALWTDLADDTLDLSGAYLEASEGSLEDGAAIIAWATLIAAGSGGGGGAVDSVFGRTGDVIAVAGDYDAGQISETAGEKILTAAERTKLAGIEDGATQDQTDAEIETAYGNQVPQVSAGEKTAGTELAIRRFSPLDVADMAGIHGGGGGGGVENPMTSDLDVGVSAIISSGNGDIVLAPDGTGKVEAKAPSGVVIGDASECMLLSNVADGPTAIGFRLRAQNNLATVGANALRIENNGGDHVLSITKEGGIKLNLNQGIFGSGSLGNSDVFVTPTSNSLHGMFASTRASYGAKPGGVFVGTTYAFTATLGAASAAFDAEAKDSYFAGASAFSNASTNIVGADAILEGGAGSSNSAGAAHGGDALVNGGPGYGSGSNGDVKIGSANTNGVGFFGATPAPRQPHIADPSGGSTVDSEARSAISSINAVLESFGLVATT